MHRVLITGSSGFIGSHLCEKLSQHHETVVLVRDLFPTTTPWGKWLSQALAKSTIVLGDVLNLKLLKRAIADYRIESVVHLAAQAIVSTAQKEPVSTFESNVLGTVNVLEACRQLDVEHALIMATDKILPGKIGACDGDPVTAKDIYATSKACATLIAESYIQTYGLKVAIPIPCNCYGFDPSPRIIPNTIRSCLKGENPIIFKGEEKTVRQYIYIEDLVEALELLIEQKLVGRFSIGTDDILTQEQVVLKILENFPNLKPKYVERQKQIKEIKKQSLNWNKMKALGWTPKYAFSSGIKETIEKFKTYGF